MLSKTYQHFALNYGKYDSHMFAPFDRRIQCPTEIHQWFVRFSDTEAAAPSSVSWFTHPCVGTQSYKTSCNKRVVIRRTLFHDAVVSSCSCFCGRPGQCASPLPLRSAICRAVRPVSPFTVRKQGDVTDSQQSHQPGRSQRSPSSGM